MYRVLLAVLLFLGTFFLLTHYSEGYKWLEVLATGQLGWIVLALFLEVFFLANLAGFYQAIFASLDIKVPFVHLFRLVLASSFMGLVAPPGALSGTALIVADATRRGISMARGVLVNLVFYLFDYAVFCLVMLAALGYLHFKGRFSPYEGIAALLMLLFVGIQVAFLVWTKIYPEGLARCLDKVISLLGFVFFPWRQWFSSLKAREFACHLAEALDWLASRPHGLWRVAGHALLAKLLSISTLGATWAAFADGVSFGPLVTSYSVGVLFTIISITPSGIGVVEGIMTAVLVSFGVEPARAALITLAYRGISLWLPFIGGMLSLHHLRSQ